MSGPAEAVALYDRAIDRLLRYHPEVVDLATTLAEEHADVPMTGALLAYLHLTSSDEPDVAVAAGALEGMAAIPMNEREQAHHDAIAAWVGGDWHRRVPHARPAARALAHRRARPAGRPPARLLPRRRRQPPRPSGPLPARPRPRAPAHRRGARHAGVRARGVGQLQRGRSGRARRALAVNPDDVWAIHAVVHAHEMRGQVADGIRFLREREADWGSGNLFTVHNWWHLALFHLEGGDIDDVLRIYDAEVHHAASQGVPLEMLDASALLWRLRLDGVSDGGRFAPLADAWATRTDGRPWYVFNDLHAVMALVGAGRIADAEGVVERLAGYVHCGGSGTNVAMTAEIGLPASRAIIRFAPGALRRRHRRAPPDPSGPPAVRRLARPAGRAPAHAARSRPAERAPRPRPLAALGAARRAGDERVRLDPPGAAARGPRAPGRRGRGRRGRHGVPGARPGGVRREVRHAAWPSWNPRRPWPGGPPGTNGVMALLRRALVALGLAALVAAVLRVRGSGGTPPQDGGWRELSGPDLR